MTTDGRRELEEGASPPPPPKQNLSERLARAAG